MSDKTTFAKHDTANHYSSNDGHSASTHATDCNAAFSAELHQMSQRPEAHKPLVRYHNHCPAESSYSNLFTKEAEKPDALKFTPYIAVGIGHSEVEPVKLTTDGIVDKQEKPFGETLTSHNPARIPEGLEAEGHFGLILEF